MSKDINTMGARSGKIIKSDNSVVNEGDGINPDGSRRVQISGSSTALDVNVLNQPSTLGIILQEQLTEVDAVSGVLAFSEPITIVDIYNADTTNTGVFTINNMAITIPADTFFQAEIGGTPSSAVSVTGSTFYVIGRYE